MNDLDQKRVQKIIKVLAAKEDISVAAVREHMLTAIKEAFSTRHEPGHETFIRMFGDRCPTVEEFILMATAYGAQNEHDCTKEEA